jgi:hypothetical protein
MTLDIGDTVTGSLFGGSLEPFDGGDGGGNRVSATPNATRDPRCAPQSGPGIKIQVTRS